MMQAINTTVSVDWRADSGALELRLSRSLEVTWWTELEARVIIDLDDDRVLDVDIIDLPPWLLERLTQYVARPRTPKSGSPVSLDWDAAWLWIHHSDGHRARQKYAKALVRFDMDAGYLVAIFIELPYVSNGAQGGSNG
jgi:hypothetical protein